MFPTSALIGHTRGGGRRGHRVGAESGDDPGDDPNQGADCESNVYAGTDKARVDDPIGGLRSIGRDG